MYRMPYYQENDKHVLLDFMKKFPFATLIGADKLGVPVATQIPFLIAELDGQIFLRGHIMKGTDHHKILVDNQQALCVFTGPHAYISASWYTKQQQASTWNYMTVQAKGSLHFLDEAALLKMLDELTKEFENNPASPSLFQHLPEDYILRLSKAIVAFEINISSLEGVFKLSQNREQESYQQIMLELSKGDENARAIASEMLQRKDKLFPL